MAWGEGSGYAGAAGVMVADAASLHALLIWIADLDVEAAASLRWRVEAREVL